MKLIFVGEATAHVSKDMQTRYPEIPWGKIVGFRNVAVHQYRGIDWNIVWNAAIADVPAFRDRVHEILANEFPEDVA